jgi:hypothetical protein
MSKLKKTISMLAVMVLIVAVSCKKDKGTDNSKTVTPVNNTVVNNSVPNISLTGTPAQNLVTVFEAGLTSVEANKDNPAKAAKGLESIMTTYKISELREKSKAEKEAGRGASDAEKKRLKDGMEKYKKLAVTIGSKDSAAFSSANAKWSAAWGIK